ncbi:hypothetical protein EW146_g6295 [Bondarzewia mesenterica]|uniref:Metallo-beta-lactamase domain-containing protein n=1 Tax=Bondarzewia mesenterica TaxID=1095465 RepID=A0A4S4LP12_9AGAM|nr:hypothetical protein EW146_g6295 [Bondarzewia mesenterica]
MTDIVIREVTKDVWTFSKPFMRLGFLPIGGRSTAIKLSNGDVWVLASTPLTDDTKKTLANLGPVKYIISADAVHHLYLGEFKKAYPEAKLLAVEEVVEKKKNEGLEFAGFWGDKQREPKFGFEGEIKSCYFSGFKNKDVAFLHEPSKTLVEADLLFNMPAIEQYSRSWFSGRTPFFGNPYSTLQKKMMWSLGVDKEAMKRDARTVAGWDFNRIIPCHGDVIEKDGNKAWRATYEHYLN